MIILSLLGRTAVITGASSGIGEAVAYALAKQQAGLILVARRQEKLEQIAQVCRQYTSQKVEVIATDMADQHQVSQLIDQLEQIGRVDILLNAAGYGIFKHATDFTTDEIHHMFEVNVLGLMQLSQGVAKMMQQRRRGHIINIASQAGKIATPKSAIYSATKFAVIGFSNALRLELQPYGIAVTTINPGPVATNFFDIADQSGEYLKNVGRHVMKTEVVAQHIMAIIQQPRREVNLPFSLAAASKLYALCPTLGDKLIVKLFNKK